MLLIPGNHRPKEETTELIGPVDAQEQKNMEESRQKTASPSNRKSEWSPEKGGCQNHAGSRSIGIDHEISRTIRGCPARMKDAEKKKKHRKRKELQKNVDNALALCLGIQRRGS